MRYIDQEARERLRRGGVAENVLFPSNLQDIKVGKFRQAMPGAWGG